MKGFYSTISGQVVDKEPISLPDNFQETIEEACNQICGELIVINELSKWAVVGNNQSPPVRLIVSDE